MKTEIEDCEGYLCKAVEKEQKQSLEFLFSSVKQSPQSIFKNNRNVLMFAAIVMLISATFNTTSTKYVNRQKLPACPNCPPTYFEAPLFQTWIGFIGQSVFLPFAMSKNRATCTTDMIVLSSQHKLPMSLRPCPKWVWAIPLFFDFASSACLNYATVLIQASSVQMLRSSNIIIIFLLTICFVRTQFFVYQTIGVALTFCGMTIVGISALLHPDFETNQAGRLQLVGVSLALLGTLFSSFQWIVEEIFFKRYSCNPYESAGWMGLYGTILGTVVLWIAYIFGVEDVKGAFYQMTSLDRRQGWILLLFNFLYLVSVGINTASGLFVTQLGSSLLRTIVNSLRITTVWLIEIILKWASFYMLHVAGLFTILLAIMIYNYQYVTWRSNKNSLFDKFDNFMNQSIVFNCLSQKTILNKFMRVEMHIDSESLPRKKNGFVSQSTNPTIISDSSITDT